MRLCWLALLLNLTPTFAQLAFHQLRLTPPPGWTVEHQAEALVFNGTGDMGALAKITGPFDPGGDFAQWFGERVKAAQEDAVDEGQPVAFRTAGDLPAMRQTWKDSWAAIFIVGTTDRTDLAILHDGQAWHAFVETGRTPEVHQAAVKAVLAMLDAVGFGADQPFEPTRIGDLTFTIPEGWKRLDRDAEALLVPEKPPDKAVVELCVPPTAEVEGSLEAWVRSNAQRAQSGETVDQPLETGLPEADPVAGPIDLGFSTTTAAGEPRVRFYHAERRDGRVVSFRFTTSGMDVWDAWWKVIAGWQQSLRVEAAEQG